MSIANERVPQIHLLTLFPKCNKRVHSWSYLRNLLWRRESKCVGYLPEALRSADLVTVFIVLWFVIGRRMMGVLLVLLVQLHSKCIWALGIIKSNNWWVIIFYYSSTGGLRYNCLIPFRWLKISYYVWSFSSRRTN